MKRMLKTLIEAATAGSAIMMCAAVESSKLCGLVGILLLLVLVMESNAWEGGV